MLRSMTGFGRGEAQGDAARVVVELRSVNHRFLDLQIRLPRPLSAAEPALRTLLADGLSRGRVDVHVHHEPGTAGPSVVVDEARYRALLQAMAQASGLSDEDADLKRLVLQQPDVVRVQEADADDQAVQAVVIEAARAARDALRRMRRTEGEALQRVLVELVDGLASQVDAVARHTQDLSTRLAERIAARMRPLLEGAEVDPARLVQEAALQADKADVTEEIDRLRAHVAQLRGLVDGGPEPVGRKLEFLLQEAHREVNTLGSKAVDAAVRSDVVELKSILERLREQAANVE